MDHFDRSHTHHIDGEDVWCINLSHCPAICDCAIDACTAEKVDYISLDKGDIDSLLLVIRVSLESGLPVSVKVDNGILINQTYKVVR